MSRFTLGLSPHVVEDDEDVIDANTMLLLHGEGPNGGRYFFDSSPYDRTITSVGTFQTSNEQSKFGGQSIRCLQSGSRIELAASEDWNFGLSTDFTVDFWVYFTAIGTSHMVGAGNMSGTGWSIGAVIGGVIRISAATNSDVSFPFSVNTWYHIEVGRRGSTVYVFGNGTLLTTLPNIDFDNDGSVLTVGANPGSGFRVFGYMDEVRITKGVCKHITNFSPRIEAYNNLSAVDTASATKFGDLTSGGGLTSVFDGVVAARADATSGQKTTASSFSYAGVDLGASKTIRPKKLMIWASTGNGFAGAAITTFKAQLYASNSMPANSTDGVLIKETGNLTDAASAIFSLSLSDGESTNFYRYIWVRMERVGGSDAFWYLAEAGFFGEIVTSP